MKDRIDKILYDNFKDDIKLPDNLADIIVKTIDEKCFNEEKVIQMPRKKYNKFYKFAIGLTTCVFLTTSVVFARQIIFKLSDLYKQKQLETTIENNYIQTNESKEYIKSNNGILYKFNHILINDINLILSIDFVFNENLDKYEGITINGLKITDENNTQIFIDSESSDIWLNNLATMVSTKTLEKKENIIKETILLIGNNFPKSEKLYISFDSIILYNIKDGEKEIKEINGKYDIEIELDRKFENRENIYYQTVNDKNQNIKIDEIKLTNTGLGITMRAPIIEGLGYTFKIYNENDLEIYSNQNDIGNYETLEKYFIWLDVEDNFKNMDYFKLKIIDKKGNENIYEVNKIR